MKRSAPMPAAPYHRPYKSARPPLIPSEEDMQKPEEGLFGSIGRLVFNTGSSVAELFGGLFKRKPHLHYQFQQQYQQRSTPSNSWPMQESFVIPDEDEPPPPSLESKTPTPRMSNYPYMTKELEKKHFATKQNNRGYSDYHHHNHHHQQQQRQKQLQNHHRHFSPNPKTYFEKNCETNEIVFGAVQEQDGRREAVVIKAVDYGDPAYSSHNVRPRLNYMGYSHGY